MTSAQIQSDIVTSALASQGDSDQLIYQEILKLIKTPIANCSSILDVGMGQGKFLALVQKKFPSIDLAGADAAEYPLAQGLNLAERLICDFNKEISAAKTFDVVTSIEVIEHLRDPRHFVGQLSKLARKGGTILLTTPNNESFNSLLSYIFRGYFSAFSPRNYPAHITPITEYQMRQIISESADLELIDVYYFKNGRIPATGLKWHRFFPFLSGKRFADNFAIVLRKK